MKDEKTNGQARHRAIVRISHEFLEQLLFPEGSKILAVMVDVRDIFERDDFVCIVEHPDLPAHQLGESLRSVQPVYHSHRGEGENEIATVTFEDWGIGG